MKYLNKQKFIEHFTSYIEDDNYNEVWVGVTSPDLPETEYIVNPRENFDGKLLHYTKAYDEDMKLKSFNQIEITDIFGVQG